MPLVVKNIADTVLLSEPTSSTSTQTHTSLLSSVMVTDASENPTVMPYGHKQSVYSPHTTKLVIKYLFHLV